MSYLVAVILFFGSSERYSDPFDLDAERHVAQAMLAELENEPRAAISELELAHLYSPTNSWITQELIFRLLRDEGNIGRAREIIDTALLYAPESPGLNRIYVLFEVGYGSVHPRLISSLWRLIEDPNTRILGRDLLRELGSKSRRAIFAPKTSQRCADLALKVLSSSKSTVLTRVKELHTPGKGCWQ